MLKINDLSVVIDGKNIIQVDSMNFGEAKFFGLLGPSGCGKSTVLRCLAGLEGRAQGNISYQNQVWLSPSQVLPPENRGVAMLFQDFALWPHMTVFENICFPLKVKSVSPKAQKEKFSDLANLLNLNGLENRLPSELSGGQKQRVALARALAQGAAILLLDEPLSSLDAALRGDLRRELKALQKKFNLLCVIVTHDWADVESLCDEVFVMNQGKVVEAGSVDHLKSIKNSSSFLSALIG